MEPVKPQREEGKTRLDCLEDTSALSDLDQTELLSSAMSSYYLLYR